jgi:hypothetical protein
MRHYYGTLLANMEDRELDLPFLSLFEHVPSYSTFAEWAFLDGASLKATQEETWALSVDVFVVAGEVTTNRSIGKCAYSQCSRGSVRDEIMSREEERQLRLR